MKIGLIAMSGVRAHDKELMKVGLTLPGFVERSKVIASLPSLSLLTIAALTPADIEVEYREIKDFAQKDSLPTDYDLVAISSLSAQISDAYRVADFYRQKKITVVMGGLHVSSLPQEAKEHCSVVVAGEGEILWPRVIQDFLNGCLQEFYIQSPQESFDLADAPMPKYELLDISKYNRLTVQTSRGCPHRCDFCASSILLTSKYKVKPVAKVIAEIRRIKELWPHPFIEFADDNSFVLRAHYKELLRALIPEDIRWFTEADISIAEDAELLQLMKQSGCKQVLIGLESPTSAGLDHVEQRRNWKQGKHEYYEKAIDEIQAHGIAVNGCFILGLDGDDDSVFDRIYQFVEKTGLFEVQITVLTPFPGTPLYQRFKQEGRLIQEQAWHTCTLFDINYFPKKMSVPQLRAGMIDLSRKLYDQEFIDQRRKKFFKNIRYRYSENN